MMIQNKLRPWFLGLVWLISMIWNHDVRAGGRRDTSIITFRSGSGRVEKRLRSWQEMRFDGIVRQNFDYSCGSASLATLMNAVGKKTYAEDRIIEILLEMLSEEELEQRIRDGFTMLDLKRAAEELGFDAVGARLPLDSLATVRGPVLAHMIYGDGYRHFTVVRGVSHERVYLADPREGRFSMGRAAFARYWSGVVMAVGRPDDEGAVPLSLRQAAGPVDFLREFSPLRGVLFP